MVLNGKEVKEAGGVRVLLQAALTSSLQLQLSASGCALLGTGPMPLAAVPSRRSMNDMKRSVFV